MRDFRLLRIIAPPSLPATPAPETLFENLLINIGKEIGGDIALECVAYGQVVHILIAAEKGKIALLKSIVFASYPDADVQEVTDYAGSADPGKSHVAGADITLKRSDVYPILTYDNMVQANVPNLTPGSDANPGGEAVRKLSQLFTALSTTQLHEQLWFQIVIRYLPNNTRFHLKRTIKARLQRMGYAMTIRDYLRPPGREELEKARETKAAEKGNMMPLSVRIRCVSVSTHSQVEAARNLRALLGALTAFNHMDINEFVVQEAKDPGPLLRDYRSRSLRKGYFFTPREVATLAFVPDPSAARNVVHVLSRKIGPPQDLPDLREPDTFPVGYTNYHDVRLPFGIRLQDRRRNMYVVGEPGVGKELFLQRMILSDIEHGCGLAVVDPHGAIIKGLLPFIPQERLKDVLLLDPADERCPIAFNPLEGVPQLLQAQFVQALSDMSRKLLGAGWSAEAEHLLQFTFSALLSTQGAQLFSVISLFKDPAHRKWVAENVQDALIKNFWTAEFDEWSQLAPSAAAVSAVLGKLSQLLASPVLQRILSQPKSSFSFRSLVEERKIVFWNVPEGYLGEQASMLLGSLFATRLGMSMVERAHADGQANDFFCYIDDFPSFVIGNLKEIFTAARQYPLNFILSHQRLSEMDETLRRTILGDVGTMMAFRLGKEEAPGMAEEFAPECRPEDLTNLDQHDFFIRMEVNGKKLSPFTGRVMGLPEKPRVREEDVRAAAYRNFPRPPAEQQQPPAAASPQAPAPAQPAERKADEAPAPAAAPAQQPAPQAQAAASQTPPPAAAGEQTAKPAAKAPISERKKKAAARAALH